ncbi:MAG TPA: hypothetical protein GXX51_12350 [Firmicutes bacterium]|nr:hypothetical protein [Bacillota bacterium]
MDEKEKAILALADRLKAGIARAARQGASDAALLRMEKDAAKQVRRVCKQLGLPESVADLWYPEPTRGRQ